MPHQCTGCGHVFPDGSKEMLSGCPDCGGNKFQFKPAGAADAGDEPTAEPPEPPDPPTEGSSVADAVAGATERVRDLVGSEDRAWPAVGREGDDGTPAARSGRERSAAGAPAGPTGSEDTAQASARSSIVDPDDLPDPPDSPAIDDGPERQPDPSPDDRADDDAPASGESSVPDDRDPPDAGIGDPGTDRDVSADDPSAVRDDPAATRDGPAATRDGPPASRDGPTPDPEETVGAPETAQDGATDEPGDSPFTGSGDRETQDDGPDLAELREELNDQFESIRIVDRGQYELNLMELYDRDEYIISLMEDGRYAIEVPEAWRGE